MRTANLEGVEEFVRDMQECPRRIHEMTEESFLAMEQEAEGILEEDAEFYAEMKAESQGESYDGFVRGGRE